MAKAATKKKVPAVKRASKPAHKKTRGRKPHTPAQKKAMTALKAKFTAATWRTKKAANHLRWVGNKWTWVKKTTNQKKADTTKSRKMHGKVNKGLKAAKSTKAKTKAKTTRKAKK